MLLWGIYVYKSCKFCWSKIILTMILKDLLNNILLADILSLKRQSLRKHIKALNPFLLQVSGNQEQGLSKK